MKTIIISLSILCFAVVLLIFLPDMVTAQPAPELPGGPEQAPIDGGLGLLMAAGGAYAVKKFRDKDK